MKPVIVDTTLWVHWLRGTSARSRQALQGRFVWMPSVVAAELWSGARTRESVLALNTLMRPFERNRRCIVLNWEDYRLAGETLAQLNWPASPKLGDALIAVSARKTGAEIWTSNTEDFNALGKLLGVLIVNPDF
ncbi:PIN domain-containing protein [Bdellovibrionota bacterium FG-1]